MASRKDKGKQVLVSHEETHNEQELELNQERLGGLLVSMKKVRMPTFDGKDDPEKVDKSLIEVEELWKML
ncbi:hypothetical protein ACH5RR_034365 [Cinchona calisaya]|uniref:Uncharacterized protein n=1 Tax=Cinchona calisaya TaxID=153742 RepID=A0ABD2YAQ5_9GENT